jgi:hypothetical protein
MVKWFSSTDFKPIDGALLAGSKHRAFAYRLTGAAVACSRFRRTCATAFVPTGETIVSDNPLAPGPQNTDVINVLVEAELVYWTKHQVLGEPL